MERGIVRVVAVVALVFLVVGDFATVLTPVLQMMGVVSETAAAKAQPVHGSRDDSGQEEENAVDMIDESPLSKTNLMATIRNSCLPKLICELNATPHRDRLTDSEKSLLSLIRDTSISTTAEVTSKYHFAAHMGQLISGVEGTGCHNFYPACPFPALQVLQMMKKVKLR